MPVALLSPVTGLPITLFVVVFIISYSTCIKEERQRYDAGICQQPKAF